MKDLKTNKHYFIFFILSYFLIFSLISGCSGSSETESSGRQDEILSSKDQAMVNQFNSSLDSIKKNNITLKEELERSQQTSSNLNIRLSEAQKEINDLKSKITEKSSDDTFLQEYNLALNSFNSKNYTTSLEKLQKLYANDPTNERAPNCLYWVGESYYGLRNYKQAIITFNQVLNAYPNSSKSDDALIMLGISYLRLKDKKNAREAFERLQQMYPDSPYITKIPKEFKIQGKENE